MAKMPMSEQTLTGFNVGNVVHSFTRSASSTAAVSEDTWTADQDCYLCGRVRYTSTSPDMQYTAGMASIDGLTIATAYGVDGIYQGVCVPVKKGQIIVVKTSNSSTGGVDLINQIKCYGLK